MIMKQVLDTEKMMDRLKVFYINFSNVFVQK